VAQHRGGTVLAMDSFRQVIRREQNNPGAGDGRVEPGAGPVLAIPGSFPTLKQTDLFLVEEAMRRANNNQGIAATLLGISRQSLNRRLQVMRGDSAAP